MPGITWPVVAYAPMPATMPNIAISPLKRSAPEFMRPKKLKIYVNCQDRLIKSGIPNDAIYAR